MILQYAIRSLLILVLACFSNLLLGQSNGITQWDNPLTVVPTTIQLNGVDFPGHTITVHGTNANKLFQTWRSEMRSQSREISGRKPTVAKNISLPTVSATPITVIGETHGGRKDPYARLTVAFAENDSTPLADNGQQEKYMYDLAVRYNQTLIDEMIADKEDDLKKAKRKYDRAGSDEKRTRKRLERDEKKMARTQARRQREERKKAELQGEVLGLQRAMQVSGEPRDQKRLLRARRSLVKIESNILKYMEDEVDYQQSIAKYRAALPEHDQEQREKNKIVVEIEREIEALRAAKEGL